ncbi:hypothetical protein E1A91_A11G097400v1 [Gossypium mustelinum]|uniref:VHS domain-containing protein n=1 Tax=Gossypium mustelinum TaxID=34275 RepID=A0A5D2X4M8_GOSMU|nr:hypothetical protein E1A91_A11G097400v1 [Gossypium mustelinum]
MSSICMLLITKIMVVRLLAKETLEICFQGCDFRLKNGAAFEMENGERKVLNNLLTK